MTHALRLSSVALFLLFLAGCASTPAQRIKKNQDLFDSLPVAEQARIRGGQINLGFTADMVRIALGASFDERDGGFGGAPKFPPSMVLEWLLRHHARTGDPDALTMARRTLDGESTIWLYLDTLRRYERQRADIDGLLVSGPGGMRSIGGSAWVNVLQEREVFRIRVEFQQGLVTAIEEPTTDTPRP